MLAIIVHNVYSSVKLIEAVDIFLEFPEADIFVVSKATSSAAQTGVPEAEKKAYIRGRRVLYIPDLKDAIDILGLEKLYLIVPERLGKEYFKADKVMEEARNSKIGIAFSGGDTAFTSSELSLGYPVTLGFKDILPPAPLMAIVLYSLYPKNRG